MATRVLVFLGDLITSRVMYSLCQDGRHRILACVIPLEEHVLELGVHILNLFVHLLKKNDCRMNSNFLGKLYIHCLK